MKQILTSTPKSERICFLDDLSEETLQCSIVAIKQGKSYGILSQVPHAGSYFFKALDKTFNCWDGMTSDSAKGVLSLCWNDTEFFLFENLKEFASWLDNELNHGVRSK
jgi:hypothetical protein